MESKLIDTMKQEEPILVAIHCLVYNHEPYLRDCFEGFVMQKTNFRFVAIVHEDCSTDGSAAIIREYEKKYPDIIKPIFETENKWSKHDGSLDHIMNDAIAATGAKYIAFCEGDDYWTDPLKLQKQVDFLESHPDYVLCCHGYQILNTADGTIEDKLVSTQNEIVFNNDDNMRHWYTKTMTLLVRPEAFNIMPDYTQFKCWRDDHFVYYALKQSKGCYLPFVGGVYRCHAGGVFGSLSYLAQEITNLCVYSELVLKNADDTILIEFHNEKISGLQKELINSIRCNGLSTSVLRAIRSLDRLLIKEKKYRVFIRWQTQLYKTVIKTIIAKLLHIK